MGKGVAVCKGGDIIPATDMLQIAWKDLFDTGTLVSGDGDSANLIPAVNDMNKSVMMGCFEVNKTEDLSQGSDFMMKLTPAFFEGIWANS